LRERGFTLIEVVISASLMAMILVSAYLCLQSATATQKMVEPRVEILQNARVAMATVAADLRAACPLSKDFEFLGMQRMMGEVEADNLDFATHNYTPRRPNEGDFCEISYFLSKDPESGQFNLFRRRNPRIALDPLNGGSREEIASGLLGLRFEYYDGFDWYDTWGDVEGGRKAQNSFRLRSNLSGMPDAVRITMWFDSNPRPRSASPAESSTTVPMEKTNLAPPLEFQTVTRLNLAASSRRSASTGAPDSGADNSSQPTPGQGNEGGSQ
jgi:general secretion pathway protein J